MSIPLPLCRCVSPHYCRCPNSRWFPSGISQHDGYLNSEPTYSVATPLGHEPGPQTSAFPPSFGQYYQYHAPAHTPSSLSASPVTFPSIPNAGSYSPAPHPTSTIPFPLRDSTSSTINSREPPAPPKRKRANATSGPRKRIRPSASSAVPQHIEPSTPSATVGVGPVPSSAIVADTVSSSSPIMSVPAPTSSVPPATDTIEHDPTYQAINHVVEEAKKTQRDGAADVYFFCIPLDSDKMPLTPELADRQSPEIPIIKHKPNSPFLGCRLCKKWRKPWKNGKGGVTTNIRRHLIESHPIEYNDIVKRFNLRRDDEADRSQVNEPFSTERWNELLVDWIAVDDQSLNVVECPEFRRWALFGRANISDKDLPHRTSLTNMIYAQHIEEHHALLNELKATLGRVSFTSDIWSDTNLTSFMALTCHFCKRNNVGRLTIANRLLAFRVVEGSHDGENIGQIMFDIVKEAGLKDKMGQWTLDNASNCNTALEKLQRCCAKECIVFDADGNRVRCFPHVINISAQTITAELKENPYMVPLLTSSEDGTDSRNQYYDALVADPVGKTRGLVSACRASGQRRTDLKKVLVDGNENHCWMPPLRVVQLLRDVETRWSSLFLMIKRVIEIYPAINVFLNNPKHAALISHLFTAEEYQVLHDIYTILEIPHAAQELLSAEKTPTLALALPAFESLITSWLLLQKTIPELSHYIGVGISKIQEYVNKGRKSRIYALAMVVNPSTKLQWIEEHWSPEDAASAKEWVLESMTAFCTSARHQNEAKGLRESSRHPVGRAHTVPDLRPSSTASLALSSGMARLKDLQSTSAIRRLVSLPVLPGTASAASPVPRNGDPPAASGLSPPITPAPATAATIELSAAEKAALEAEKCKGDRQAAENELARYLDAGLTSMLSDLNLVSFWDEMSTTHPLLFSISLDILPVQASAVPCERAFSSSKMTCTDRRNRMLPKLVEALQLLKFIRKQERLDFMSGLLAKEEDYTIEGDITNAAIQELLALGQIEELKDLLENARQAERELELQS